MGQCERDPWGQDRSGGAGRASRLQTKNSGGKIEQVHRGESGLVEERARVDAEEQWPQGC